MSPTPDHHESSAEEGSFGVPVALFNFNRPHLTRQVFEIVRKIKPRRLLLVADGPRMSTPDDAQLCAEVRAIFDDVDWDCEVSRNFSDTNLGSFKRNSSGLKWVFDTVDEAIILEDDCVPSLSFFPYCASLLDRYRNDPRVGVISGNNFSSQKFEKGNDSYYFSAYTFNWGWASWRRTWKNVDIDMLRWKPEQDKKMLRAMFPKRAEWQYWYELYERIRLGKQRNAWDCQLLLASLRNSQCCAIPRVNLVSNIGFGSNATNCTDANSPLQNLPISDLTFPLVHPSRVRRSVRVDHALFSIVFQHQQTLWQRAKNKLVRTLRRLGIRPAGG